MFTLTSRIGIAVEMQAPRSKHHLGEPHELSEKPENPSER
jgi:hypothetical protein